MKIAWIGAGRMTQAFLTGFQTSEPSFDHHVSTRTVEKLKDLKHLFHVQVHTTNVECVKAANIVVLAIKPQQMQSVLSEIKNSISKETLVISIAAALSIKQLETWLEKPTKILRLMPNTAVALKQGSMAYAVNNYVESTDVQVFHQVFSPLGNLHAMDESKINAFIASSGSGIAFVYHLLDAFISAGAQQGFSHEEATQLSYETFEAALAMAKASKMSLSDLIDQVCSKGGTTIEGIQVLKNANLVEVFNQTFSATIQRSVALQKELGEVAHETEGI